MDLFQKQEFDILNQNYTTGTPLWKHWDEFQIKYLRTGKSEATISNVRDVLRFIIRNTKILTIEDCNNSRLLEDKLFEIKGLRNHSNTTYNSILKNLTTYFIWLEKQEYIEKNNIRKVLRCKEEQREQLTLGMDQVRTIVGQIHTRRQSELQRTRNSLFIDILRSTGARPCELLNIQIGDIKSDGESYKLVIKGKKQKISI